MYLWRNTEISIFCVKEVSYTVLNVGAVPNRVWSICEYQWWRYMGMGNTLHQGHIMLMYTLTC